MSYFDISLIIQEAGGDDVFVAEADKPWESSSTIKLPIIILAINKMIEHGLGLNDSFARMPHHSSKGSGILNWTEASSFTIKDLLQTALVYSDCLATNILIDFVGGQHAINIWLNQQGLKTQLYMPYLVFTEKEIDMPKVGQTTAREMLELFKIFDKMDCPSDMKELINRSSRSVHESWLEIALPGRLDDLRHKTGSMIDCGEQGETVFNAAGAFSLNDKPYFFCLLSHGWLNRAKKSIPFENMRRDVAKYFFQHVQTIL